MRLRLIGYWQSERTPQWPHPAALVDHGWDDDERETVAGYLAHGCVARAHMGMSACRRCGCVNGNLLLTDGTYIWPNSLAHYVRDHAVRLPAEFVAYVHEREAAMDGLEIDQDWWRRQSE